MPVFVLENPPDPQGAFPLSPADLVHLTQVLRCRAGETFEVLLPGGQRGLARLVKRGKNRGGTLVSVLNRGTPALLPLWLGIGLIRWPRFEWLVEKATELGVKRLTPLVTERTRLTKIEKLSELKYNRLIKISKETLKQCARPQGPQIDRPISFVDFLKATEAPPSCQKILFNERIEGPLLQKNSFDLKSEFIILAGPEGGWTDQEIEAAETAGFQSLSLGPLTLRTETAALYGACILQFTRQA